MKKIISFLIAFVSIFSLCGCQANLNNTPTKQVEIFLGKYQTLDKDILDDLDKVIAEEESFNASQRDTYRGIMKKHYQDLEYNVKDETMRNWLRTNKIPERFRILGLSYYVDNN